MRYPGGNGRRLYGVAMPAKLIKREPVYSNRVMRRLDKERPKYSEAVKSISAFIDTRFEGALANDVFEVLVGQLDAACKEASLMQLFDDPPGYDR